ncbi:SH3 domain-containing protein C23A1.17-like [Sinocyclocheilus anshuiensis]|uniref:SH3 domain-containing protein C23A1.17-like n=1 Tax=Sinocyclocheilus anshuiensis TaxID=1608454 RepID=UPI0007B9540D|nr:PREDICTED: SH3 domain-containing protein C23A1.17-like [Sinocyclocheilus anshuiensis]
MGNQRRMGSHRLPVSTLASPLYQRMLQLETLSSLRQRGTELREFAMEFRNAAEGLGYNDSALKDLLNYALDEPISPWSMLGCNHVSFEGFVEFLARSSAKGAAAPPVMADKAAAPPKVADEAAAPPVVAEEVAAPPEAADETAALPVVAEEVAAPPEAADEAAAPRVVAEEVAAPPEAADEAAALPVVAEEVAAPPEAADKAAAPPVVAEGVAAPPEAADEAAVPPSRKRRRRKKASSVLQGREASLEPGALPAPPKLLALPCLGLQHAEAALVNESCVYCGSMNMALLRSCLSLLKGSGADPSVTTRPGFSATNRGPPVSALGDLRVTVRASPPGHAPWTSHSSRSTCPVRPPDDSAGRHYHSG